MKIFLNGSRRSVAALSQADELLTKLAETATGGLLIARPLFDALTKVPAGAEPVEQGDRIAAELAVSLGGDGSFLRTAQWVGQSRTPILGVNAGHLGFLADMTPEEFMAMPPADLATLRKEPRKVLRVSSSVALPEDFNAYALNDVALLKTDSASMISVEAEIDGVTLTTYRADGLIVSTPTGSTGYNLSVGGPILQPTVDLLLISPIAPHQLAMRPLGVSGSSRIHLRVRARAGAFMLSLDGRSLPLPEAAEIEIEPAGFEIIVAQRPGHHFAATLRSKLLWGETSLS